MKTAVLTSSTRTNNAGYHIIRILALSAYRNYTKWKDDQNIKQTLRNQDRVLELLMRERDELKLKLKEQAIKNEDEISKMQKKLKELEDHVDFVLSTSRSM
jgi:hypothetical protein